MRILYLIMILPILLFCTVLSGQILSEQWNPGVSNFAVPDVAGIATYGSTPVSMFTGVPDISIPLYEIKVSNLSIPLKINYHSGNVKPNIHPGIVGLGWSLFAGGVITRTINHLADEQPGVGIYRNEQRFLGGAKNFTEDSLLIFAQDYKTITIDRCPDKFSFNFLNYSGCFYRNIDGTWKVVSETKFKIEHEFATFESARPHIIEILRKVHEPFLHGATFHKFKLTAPDGTIYIFGGDAIDYNVDYGGNGRPLATSWHLLQITTPQGHNVVFDYEDNDPVIEGNLSFQIQSNFIYPSSCAMFKFEQIMPVRLKSISIGYQQLVSFNYEPTVEKGFKTEFGNRDDYFKLFYVNLIEAARYYVNSFAEIKWNQLSSVTINDKIRYNFNYTSSEQERLKLLSLEKISLVDPLLTEKHAFSYYPGKFPDYLSGHFDHLGFYNGENFTAFYTSDFFAKGIGSKYQEVYNQYANSRMADRTGQFVFSELLETIKYPTGGSTLFVYEPHRVKSVVSSDRQALIAPSSDGFSYEYPGGMRIKQIKNYDENNQWTTTKGYYYVQDFDPATKTGNSSGILSFIPKYSWELKLLTLYPSYADTRIGALNMFVSEATNQTCLNESGMSVGYSEVVECDEDINGKLLNGYTKYMYTNFDQDAWGVNHFDNPPSVLLNQGHINPSGLGYHDDITTLTPYLPFVAVSSRANERGKLSAEKIYDNNNNLKRFVRYRYSGSNDDFLWGVKYKTTPPLAHVDFFKGRFVFGSLYKIYTSDYLLKEKETVVYEGSQSSSFKTEYTYNAFNQPTSEKTTYNNKDIYEVKAMYLSDLMAGWMGEYTDLPIRVYAVMRNKYMMNVPIQKTVSKDGSVIGAETVGYKLVNNEMPVPETKYRLETTAPVTDFTSMSIYQGVGLKGDSRCLSYLSFREYDCYGNPMYAINPRTSDKKIYLWSYHGQHAVAEISNCSYSTLKNVLGQTFLDNLSGKPTPTYQDFVALDGLRSLLPNAQIVTHKYEPYIGSLIREMDPSGRSVSYEYDEFGRLIYKLDENQNIIEKCEYNYKH